MILLCSHSFYYNILRLAAAENKGIKVNASIHVTQYKRNYIVIIEVNFR